MVAFADLLAERNGDKSIGHIANYLNRITCCLHLAKGKSDLMNLTAIILNIPGIFFGEISEVR